MITEGIGKFKGLAEDDHCRQRLPIKVFLAATESKGTNDVARKGLRHESKKMEIVIQAPGHHSRLCIELHRLLRP